MITQREFNTNIGIGGIAGLIKASNVFYGFHKKLKVGCCSLTGITEQVFKNYVKESKASDSSIPAVRLSTIVLAF